MAGRNCAAWPFAVRRKSPDAGRASVYNRGPQDRLGFGWRTLIAAELVFGASSKGGGVGWFIFEKRNDLAFLRSRGPSGDRHPGSSWKACSSGLSNRELSASGACRGPREHAGQRNRKAGASREANLSGAVDAWECDQMGHMNIQFYAQRFDLSNRSALMTPRQSHGNDLLVREKLGPLRERLTFHSELRAGAPIEITMSALEPVDPGIFRVRHALTRTEDGLLAATADIDYEVYEQRPQEAPGRATQPSVLVDKSHVGLRHCGRSSILDGDVQNTRLRRQKLVAMLNYASCHAGLERGRQRDLEGRLIVGSATLDMEIALHGPVRGHASDVKSLLTKDRQVG